MNNPQSNPQPQSITIPYYLKLSQIVMGISVFFYILFIGQEIILPLIFATLFAIVLNPFVNFLCKKGMNRIAAISLALLAGIILVFSLMYFLSSQATIFTETFPKFKEKFNVLLLDTSNWVTSHTHIEKNKIDGWIAKTKSDGLQAGAAYLGHSLSAISNLLVLVFLIPVYIFMILFYKPLLMGFFAKVFPQSQHVLVLDVLQQSKTLIQSYLIGLLVEAAIVAVLNCAGLLILGIQYAFLLGVIGAILNAIPYIGGIIAIAMPMLIAFATKTPTTALLVIIVYMIVQFIDNHYIVPKIVASRVKINALISIIVVLGGGALWGVPGMFLSIPLTAIIKVVFDRIEPLKPFGFLLGDDQPPITKVFFQIPRRKKKDPTVVVE